MSTALLALGAIGAAALLTAALFDHTQWVSYSDLATDRAERASHHLVESCVTDCALPPGAEICLSDTVLRVTATAEWTPKLLRGLTPATGEALVALNMLDPAWAATVPDCPSS